MDANNLQEWKLMNDEMEVLDANREKIIKELREVQKLSKVRLFSPLLNHATSVECE
jgi:hypothetical protein